MKHCNLTTYFLNKQDKTNEILSYPMKYSFRISEKLFIQKKIGQSVKPKKPTPKLLGFFF